MNFVNNTANIHKRCTNCDDLGWEGGCFTPVTMVCYFGL